MISVHVSLKVEGIYADDHSAAVVAAYEAVKVDCQSILLPIGIDSLERYKAQAKIYRECNQSFTVVIA